MPFLIVVALVTFLTCAVAGLNEHAVRAMTAVGHGAVALAAIVLPRTRSAAFEALKRFERVTWPYAALLLMAAVMSGVFGIGASGAPYDAERAMVSLAGLGFLFVAMTAIATAVGRNRVIASLHWTPLAIALLTIIDRLDGKGDFFGVLTGPASGAVTASFNTPAQCAAAFGLFAVLAAFAIVDQLTRRQMSPSEPALARRLFLPVASLVASVNLMALSGAVTGMAAAAAGVSLFLLIAWRRQRRSRNSRKEASYAAMAATGAFTLLALFWKPGVDIAQHDALARQAWRAAPLFGDGPGAAAAAGDLWRWLAETGIVGAGLLAATFGVLLWILWRADDHGRRPSRGFALAASALLCSVLNGVHGAAFDAPATPGVLAALLGVAAAYIDPPMVALKVKQTARTRVL